MTAQALADRDLRQREIVPPERLARCEATVVGVGAIGRQVALQLAAMGLPKMQLVDPDTVESVNLGCQGYLETDLGALKVEATANLCRQLNHSVDVQVVSQRFRRSMEVGNVLFCCVDQIDTRKLIWESVQHRVDIFVDGRMAAELLRVLVAWDSDSRSRYPASLFPGDQAYQGSCTAKSTIFCANIAAGMMVSQFSRWLRRLPLDYDIWLNLMSSELILPVARPPQET